MTTKLTKSESTQNLIESGSENVKKEDAYGETKSGWWQDTVFLSKDPVEAWELLNGE